MVSPFANKKVVVKEITPLSEDHPVTQAQKILDKSRTYTKDNGGEVTVGFLAPETLNTLSLETLRNINQVTTAGSVAPAQQQKQQVLSIYQKFPELPKISYEQIAGVGSDVQQKSSALSTEIARTMSVADLGSLGEIQVAFTNAAQKLDLSKYTQREGLLGKLSNLFVDIKTSMTRELATVETMFDDVEKRLEFAVAKTNQLVSQMEQLNVDNFNQACQVDQYISQIDSYISGLQKGVEFLKQQETSTEVAFGLQELNTNLNAALIKREFLTKQKMAAELLAPQITGRRDSYRQQSVQLRDIMTLTMNQLKIQFSLAIADIKNKTSEQLQKELKLLANNSMITAAESGSAAQINSAQMLNSAFIESNTLLQCQQLLSKTLTEVKQIQETNQQRIISESEQLKQGRQDLLEQLSN